MREGDRVKAGDLVARLDLGETALAVERDRRGLESSQARYEDLQAGSRAAEIKAAEEEVADRRAALELAKPELERAEILLSKKVGTPRDVDVARTNVERAAANLKMSEERLRLSREGSRRHQTEQARADVGRAQSVLKQSESVARESEIRAPADGVILHRMAEPGLLLGAGQPAVTMAFANRLYVRTFVPETQLGRVRSGSPAEVTVDAFPGRVFPARVTEISPDAEFTPKPVDSARRAREPRLRRQGRPRRRVERAARPRPAGGRARAGRGERLREKPGQVIRAERLVRSFGGRPALRGIDLTIDRGEMFALIGPDGAGKTTFFRIVAGLLAPTSGRVVRDDVPFGLVPQRFSLYEDLTVDENLALRARLYAVPSAEAGARAKDLLARVGLDRFGSRLAGALSGGMKQKLALVAALLTRPALLLLDEPTTGVDPVSRREFWQVLNALHHEGLTIVVSTPYMDEAEYATRSSPSSTTAGSRPWARGQEILASYPRPLVEIRSSKRLEVKKHARERARGRRRLALRDEASRERKRREDRGFGGTRRTGGFLRRRIARCAGGHRPGG